MKVHEIIRETVSSGGFGAGSFATVAKPLGKMRRRKDSIFASKKTKAEDLGLTLINEDDFISMID